MHVQLSQRIMFQHLKQFLNSLRITFFLHGIGMIQFHFFFCPCGLVYSRQGLLGYPLLGLYSLCTGLVTQTSWPPSRSPYGMVVLIFTVIILALLFNHIFKIHLLNMPNHSHLINSSPVGSKH